MRHLAIPTILLVFQALPAAADQTKTADPRTAAPRLELESCRLPSLDEEARCGTYEVWENRAARQGRRISLRVAVLPALGDDPAPDPVLFFAGGPGGSAVDAAPELSFIYHELRRHRDLLLIDQRGTGRSHPLECSYQGQERGVEQALEEFLPTEGVRACRDELEKQADLTRYTTADAVDDFDEVRAALGYEKVNLVGGSYGTRVVQTYLRRHPEVVRTAVLEGVVPFDARSPLTFAHDAQQAFDGLAAECAADPDCHRAFPDPAGDLRAVLARLDEAPVAVPIVDPESGEEKSFQVSRNVFIQTLRYMLYNPISSLQVPLFLRRAGAGDFAPIGQQGYTAAGGLLKSLPDGIYLSVTCAEDVAFIDPAAIPRSTEGTFLGDFRVRQQRAACALWPRAEVAEGFLEPVRSEVPTLVLSGERDPVTPPGWGAEVARTLPNSRHLVVPDGAHGFFGLPGAECVDRLVAELVDSGRVDGLDVDACAAAVRRPPFPLELPSTEAVALSEEELRRFAGTYVTEQGGFMAVVDLVGGELRVSLGDEPETLVPVGPRRFLPKGAPPGTHVDFLTAGDDGAVTGLEVFQGGVSLVVLQRKR